MYSCYRRRLCRSAWVERSSPSVCLFVRSITPKRKISNDSNLLQEMIFEYRKSDMVLGLKGQRLRLELGLGLTATRHRGSNSMSAFLFI